MEKRIYPFRRLLLLTAFFLAAGMLGYAQERSNLDRFYELAGASMEQLLEQTAPQDSVTLQFNLADDYKVFENRLIGVARDSGYPVVFSDAENLPRIIYTLLDVKVVYGEPERDGLFGDFQVERQLYFRGSYDCIGLECGDDFWFTERDTILYEDINLFETASLPFTRGEKPDPPVFSSLLEPVLIVTSAAVAVILFFTVRSK